MRGRGMWCVLDFIKKKLEALSKTQIEKVERPFEVFPSFVAKDRPKGGFQMAPGACFKIMPLRILAYDGRSHEQRHLAGNWNVAIATDSPFLRLFSNATVHISAIWLIIAFSFVSSNNAWYY